MTVPTVLLGPKYLRRKYIYFIVSSAAYVHAALAQQSLQLNIELDGGAASGGLAVSLTSLTSSKRLTAMPCNHCNLQIKRCVQVAQC